MKTGILSKIVKSGKVRRGSKSTASYRRDRRWRVNNAPMQWMRLENGVEAATDEGVASVMEVATRKRCDVAGRRLVSDETAQRRRLYDIISGDL